MTDESGERDHEEFLRLFRRGLQFSEELLAENEKLRYENARLSRPEPTGDPHVASYATFEQLRQRVAELEQEKAALLESFRDVELKNEDYQARYAEIEDEHNNLANLYIASYQLHSTLDFVEVIQVISEVVINLVGVHRFSLMLLDPSSETLFPIFAEGQPVTDVADVSLGEGPIGAAVGNKERFVAAAGDADPRAVIPLETLERRVGALVINELLVQKPDFTQMDHELFTLLSAHAATALVSSLLHDSAAPGAVDEIFKRTHVRSLLDLS